MGISGHTMHRSERRADWKKGKHSLDTASIQSEGCQLQALYWNCLHLLPLSPGVKKETYADSREKSHSVLWLEIGTHHSRCVLFLHFKQWENTQPKCKPLFSQNSRRMVHLVMIFSLRGYSSLKHFKMHPILTQKTNQKEE